MGLGRAEAQKLRLDLVLPPSVYYIGGVKGFGGFDLLDGVEIESIIFEKQTPKDVSAFSVPVSVII
jgi:hypothetical protein